MKIGRDLPSREDRAFRRALKEKSMFVCFFKCGSLQNIMSQRNFPVSTAKSLVSVQPGFLKNKDLNARSPFETCKKHQFGSDLSKGATGGHIINQLKLNPWETQGNGTKHRAQNHPTLGLRVYVCVCSVTSNSCDPRDSHLPGSSVHGILQAIILEWVAISFSRGSSQPRNQTQASCIIGRLFTNCKGVGTFMHQPPKNQ